MSHLRWRSATSVCAALLANTVVACSSSTGPGAEDSGSDVRHPDAARDASMHEASVHDSGMKDASVKDAGAPGLTCGKLILCDEKCGSSSSCPNVCYAGATGTAQGLYNALNNCISIACPGTDGGVCATNDGACSNCESASATGACLHELDSCEADAVVAPPDVDGGSVVIPDSGTTDAGSAPLSCGALLTCVQACAAGDSSCENKCNAEATSAAVMLDDTLSTCIGTNCPSTDGGACASSSTSCSGCQVTAIWGNCITQLNACEADQSGGGDGGSALHVVDGGTITTLLTPVGYPQCLVVHGGTAYLTSSDPPGYILSVPVDGGNPSTFIMNEPALYTVALDDKNLYLLSGGSFPGDGLNNQDGKVFQYPLLDGGVPGTPITLASGLEYAFNAAYLPALAVDSTTVYWVAGAAGTDGVVMSAPIGGGAVTTLYTGQAFPTALVADDTNLYWANWGTFQSDGTYNSDGAIMKAPKASGSVSPVALASGQLSPLAMAIDASNVYWTTAGVFSSIGLPPPNGGTVAQVSKAGGSAVTLASALNIPVGIAVGAHDVVWANWALGYPGTVVSVPIGGGPQTALVTNATDPYALAISGASILWSDYPPYNSNGALLRATLPMAP
jgi:hypothetical protein